MDICEDGPDRPAHVATRYRDGLLIAILIACPMGPGGQHRRPSLARSVGADPWAAGRSTPRLHHAPAKHSARRSAPHLFRYCAVTELVDCTPPEEIGIAPTCSAMPKEALHPGDWDEGARRVQEVSVARSRRRATSRSAAVSGVARASQWRRRPPYVTAARADSSLRRSVGGPPTSPVELGWGLHADDLMCLSERSSIT